MKQDHFYKFEMLILSLLNKSDLEFFDIFKYINNSSHNYIKIKKGVLFTILYHLEIAQLISHYNKNNQDFYHIEEPGQVRYDMLKRDYQNLNTAIESIMQSKISEDYQHE